MLFSNADLAIVKSNFRVAYTRHAENLLTNTLAAIVLLLCCACFHLLAPAAK